MEWLHLFKRPPDRPLKRATVAQALLLLAGAVAGCGGPIPGAAPSDAGADVMTIAATCSTMAVHPENGLLMEPGGDCIDCHAKNGVVSFAFGGTVMNALHDTTDCAGVSDVIVRVTGADGKKVELTTNASGNFYALESQVTLSFPYTAEITRNGVTVPMVGKRSATETDCASCHTSVGRNGAPGRILAP